MMAAEARRDAPARQRSGGIVVAAVAALLIAGPGLLAVSRAAPGVSGVPPALDRFLAAVRRATPSTARLLVAGNPPGTTFYRASYLLYPRTVYTAFSTDFAHSTVAPAVDWRELRRQARQDRARYVLLWSLSLRAQERLVDYGGRGVLHTPCLQSGRMQYAPTSYGECTQSPAPRILAHQGSGILVAVTP